MQNLKYAGQVARAAVAGLTAIHLAWAGVFLRLPIASCDMTQYSSPRVNQSYCTLGFYVNFSETMPHVTTYSGKHYQFMVMRGREYIGFSFFLCLS